MLAPAPPSLRHVRKLISKSQMTTPCRDKTVSRLPNAKPSRCAVPILYLVRLTMTPPYDHTANHAFDAAALISSAPSKFVPCSLPRAPATHARATLSLDTGGDSATCSSRRGREEQMVNSKYNNKVALSSYQGDGGHYRVEFVAVMSLAAPAPTVSSFFAGRTGARRRATYPSPSLHSPFKNSFQRQRIRLHTDKSSSSQAQSVASVSTGLTKMCPPPRQCAALQPVSIP